MSQYNLKISDVYDLLIGDGFKLFVDEVSGSTGIAAAKRWNGTEWKLIYDYAVYDGVTTKRFNRINYWDGSSWVNASLK